ncbi:hypothetical protein SLS58_008720 [Diplodia intermedia]|uniref:Uncharacterized protein n=1 Tax=Diplodia intermedia TaxID=856260 RepID=A0ABR3TGZ1_9PEZI
MDSGVKQVAEMHDDEPSRLEAALMNASVPMRPMSRGAGNVSRHVTAGDHDMREFDLDFSLCHDRYPFSDSRSLQDLMASIQLETLLKTAANFDTCTNIQCFEITEDRQGQSLSHPSNVFISSIPRVPYQKPATYACKTFLTGRSMRELFSELSVDPSFAMNTLGRPDYWAPVTRATLNKAGDLEAFGKTNLARVAK